MRRLTDLRFDNTYARLPEIFYSKLAPTPFSDPYLISFNTDAARLIDLDPAEASRPEFAERFSGGLLLPGSDPLAMIYSGHQFGHYVRQLGDGRAILLGEVRNEDGEKWDLHLKGAGQTPFSRGFDGRAVLRSAIREYLCSEAMHGLGIPTTRALCIVGSNEPVYRETVESAAMLLRMSPSHIRFGTFEYFYYNEMYDQVRLLADYAIEHHFPHLINAEEKYLQLLIEAVKSTAHLIAKWQAVGFAHGVMNTDNMSILGITIDYGPFGFMDDFDAGFICNHSDEWGRYAFNRQPEIGRWNLACFAQSLLSLISEEQALSAIEEYEPAFSDHYAELMRSKLGLRKSMPEDLTLTAKLLQILQANHIDYAKFFRALGDFNSNTEDDNAHLRDMFIDWAAFKEWAERYRFRLIAERSIDAERKERMNRANPKYVLRNYLAQNAIAKAVENRDYLETNRLLELLRNPFDERIGMEQYAEPPPDWGKKIVVSCSS